MNKIVHRCVGYVRAHVCACVYTHDVRACVYIHIQIVAVYHRYICISICAYALKLTRTCMFIRRCVDDVHVYSYMCGLCACTCMCMCVYTHSDSCNVS